jgi:hypothetical protein
MQGKKTHIRGADKMKKTKSLRRRVYNSSDRQLRIMIFKYVADHQVGGRILVADMEAIFNWIKGPKSPRPVAKGKPKLTMVKGDAPRL